MANETRVAKTLIRLHLLGQDAIQTLVDDRVLGEHASDDDAGSVKHPSVIVGLTGGGGHYSGIIQSVRFEVSCYSRTSQDEASRLYDLCYLALQAECLSHSSLDMTLLCEELRRPTEGWNKSTKAWFTVGEFIANGAG